jgi:cadmium resistance protein CadD (predicted permease)
MNFPGLLALGVAVFASTNIDDLFVLMVFFADPDFPAQHVILGQYTGILTLVALSLLGALVALVIPAGLVGLLGLLPLAIGLKKLLDLRKPADEGEPSVSEECSPTRRLRFLTIALVTFSNGGDNIGVYVPLFATRGREEVVFLIALFAVMVALWCAMSYLLVKRTVLGRPVRRFGHILLPFVLIALGLSILAELFV